MAAVRRVAVLLFDDVEVLDFAGPFEVFGVAGWARPRPPFDVYTVALTARQVLARNQLRIDPDYPAAGCPRPDVFVVPGGFGTRRQMHNPAMLDFVRTTVEEAELVLSVCTGALLLGAAGLLDGLHATTHRAAIADLRAAAPAAEIHPDARGIDNGKIILSTGISAGLDMALYAVAKLCGRELADETADYMHYDWRYREPDGTTIIRTH